MKPFMDSRKNKSVLMRGIRQLREAAGEQATLDLIRSDQDKRKEMWVQLMKSGDPAILEALSNILIGLGFDPDDLIKEVTDEV